MAVHQLTVRSLDALGWQCPNHGALASWQVWKFGQFDEAIYLCGVCMGEILGLKLKEFGVCELKREGTDDSE